MTDCARKRDFGRVFFFRDSDREGSVLTSHPIKICKKDGFVKILKLMVPLLLPVSIASCGTGDPVVGASGGGGGSESESFATYFPLQFYLNGDGYVEDSGVFDGVWFNPLIHGHVIAPVNASNLQPLEDPSVDDYSLTIDGEPVSYAEHGLMLQRIVDLPVTLRTALIIDTSSSNSSAVGVDESALVAEIKRYLEQVALSSNQTVRDQEFTILAYADPESGMEPLVDEFTSDRNVLNAGLDSLLEEGSWESRGRSSATYEAIVRAVGRYIGSGSASRSSDLDLLNDSLQDLTESYLYDGEYLDGTATQLTGMRVSNVILISSGANTNTQTFTYDDALAALQWQSLLQYSTENQTGEGVLDGDAETQSSETVAVGKPMYYVSVASAAQEADERIASLASAVIDTNSLTSFNFSSALVANQENGLAPRVRPDNQYLVRYSLFERDGTHEVVLASESNGYNYRLTTELDFSDGSALGDPQVEPQVEITTAQNEYLPLASLSVSSVNELHPATRWTAINYGVNDYVWTVDGVERPADEFGAIKLTSSDIGRVVTLTNTSLSGPRSSASLELKQ